RLHPGGQDPGRTRLGAEDPPADSTEPDREERPPRRTRDRVRERQPDQRSALATALARGRHGPAAAMKEVRVGGPCASIECPGRYAIVLGPADYQPAACA